MMIEKTLEIKNHTGLHARPASLFVSLATKFKSDIFIIFKGQTANAKSMLNVLSLGIPAGNTFQINADGVDEETALSSLTELVESNFGES